MSFTSLTVHQNSHQDTFPSPFASINRNFLFVEAWLMMTCCIFMKSLKYKTRYTHSKITEYAVVNILLPCLSETLPLLFVYLPRQKWRLILVWLGPALISLNCIPASESVRTKWLGSLLWCTACTQTYALMMAIYETEWFYGTNHFGEGVNVSKVLFWS